MKTILITGAGGAGTIEIIRTLKDKYRIVAVDASPYAYGLRLADAAYTVPLATNPDFHNMFAIIVEKEKPNYIIPLVDEEILTVHPIAGEYGIRVLAPRQVFCGIALDKWLTNQILKKLDVPIPISSLTYSDFGNNLFIGKPRHGRGSRGLIYNPDKEYQDYVYQEQIFGIEYTVSVVVGLDNSLITIVPKEVILKKGITFIGVTRKVPVIDKVCHQIVEKLNPCGPFNVQLIMRDNIPYITEINPRYSTTVALTIAAGVHEVDLVIRQAEGEQLPPVDFIPNLVMNRYYTQEYYEEVSDNIC